MTSSDDNARKSSKRALVTAQGQARIKARQEAAAKTRKAGKGGKVITGEKRVTLKKADAGVPVLAASRPADEPDERPSLGELTTAKDAPTDLSALFASTYADQLAHAQRTKVRRMLTRLGIFVLLPTLIAALYFSVIATPRYVSESQVVVTSSSQGLVSMLGGIVQTSDEDARYLAFLLENYIYSVPLVETVDKWLKVREHFSNPEVDYLSRATAMANQQSFLSYWKRRVEVELDTTTLIMTIRTHAFDPDMAKAINDSVVALCEEMTDRLASRARTDALTFARNEVANAEKRAKAARAAIADFRSRHGDFDPQASASTLGGVIGKLEAQLVEARTEQARLASFMRPDSQAAKSIASTIASLEQQIAEERLRLARSDGSEGGYSARLIEYQELMIEEDLANKAVGSALANMDLTRQEAARKHTYVEAFVEAAVPDIATEPDPVIGTTKVLVISFIVYLLGSLIVATIQEQARL